MEEERDDNQEAEYESNEPSEAVSCHLPGEDAIAMTSNASLW